MKKLTVILIITSLFAIFAVVLILINQNRNSLEPSLYTGKIICDATDPKLCKTDQDCICIENTGCFMGNKDYYQECVDKTGACRDLCVGWEQKPVKCINNKCSISY